MAGYCYSFFGFVKIMQDQLVKNPAIVNTKLSICIFYKTLLTGYCMYTVNTQPVHVLDTACLRTCNESDTSCVLTNTRGQSWNIRQPSVHARYTFSIHPVQLLCTGRGRASTRGQSWNIRKPYTFSTRSVYTQYTSCVQGSRRASTRSLHVQYTSSTRLVYKPWTGSRRASTRGQSWKTRQPYTFCIHPVHVRYTRLFVLW